jgi:ABC-type microcin C transport system permease subunit YejE
MIGGLVLVASGEVVGWLFVEALVVLALLYLLLACIGYVVRKGSEKSL